MFVYRALRYLRLVFVYRAMRHLRLMFVYRALRYLRLMFVYRALRYLRLVKAKRSTDTPPALAKQNSCIYLPVELRMAIAPMIRTTIHENFDHANFCFHHRHCCIAVC
jgi:hypothetical protein